MLDYSPSGRNPISRLGRRVTTYRGQKSWTDTMVIEACSLRRSGGQRPDQERWTRELLNGFRLSIAGAVTGDQDSKNRLQTLLLNAQRFAFQNPFVSTSLSYSVARSFATAGDTDGHVLTIEGPWQNGLDFEFLRKTYSLYGDVFDYLQEYGLPAKLEPPYSLVKVERVSP